MQERCALPLTDDVDTLGPASGFKNANDASAREATLKTLNLRVRRGSLSCKNGLGRPGRSGCGVFGLASAEILTLARK